MVKLLDFENVLNFRDLGGYHTAKKARVKFGQVYRAGSLAHLTASEQADLVALGIQAVMDFRDYSETEVYPDNLPEGLTYYNLRVYPFRRHLWQNLGPLTYLKIRAWKLTYQEKVYLQMAFDPHAQKAYRKFFQILLKTQAPLIFHCTAGKDRTGLAAFYLLSVLGIQEEEVNQDYLLTNLIYAAYNDQDLTQLLTQGTTASLAQRLNQDYHLALENLQVVRQVCQMKYGTVINFVTQVLGVSLQDIEALKGWLLENDKYTN